MSLIIPWGIFTRYVLGTGSQWPEPIAIQLMVLFTFLGAAVAYRAGSHIAVAMLTDRLPEAAAPHPARRGAPADAGGRGLHRRQRHAAVSGNLEPGHRPAAVAARGHHLHAGADRRPGDGPVRTRGDLLRQPASARCRHLRSPDRRRGPSDGRLRPARLLCRADADRHAGGVRDGPVGVDRRAVDRYPDRRGDDPDRCGASTSSRCSRSPFFVLAGAIMAEGGMSRRLVAFAGVLVGFIRGGLSLVNILASTFFGAISGSSMADTASIGSVLIPEMAKKGYPKRLRHRGHRQRLGAGDPHSAVAQRHHLLAGRGRLDLDRRAVRRRRAARSACSA